MRGKNSGEEAAGVYHRHIREHIAEKLKVYYPRQWKVIQTVREKFSCRECEKITQPPAENE